MPELTGSPKQVSWAEEIRRKALSTVDSFVKQSEDEFKLSFPGGGYVSPNTTKQVRNDLVSAFQGVSSAKQIIDNRLVFSESNIRSQIFALENQKRKKR